MPFEIPDDDGWDDDALIEHIRDEPRWSSKQADLTMTVGTRPSVEMRNATGAGTGRSHSFVTANSADRYPRVGQGHTPAPNPPPPAPAPRRTTVVAGPFDDGDDDDFLLEALAATERRAMSASAGPPRPATTSTSIISSQCDPTGAGTCPSSPSTRARRRVGTAFVNLMIRSHHHHATTITATRVRSRSTATTTTASSPVPPRPNPAGSPSS